MMKHIKTFESFLKDETDVKLNESLQDTQFLPETAQRLWGFILDAANASKTATDNTTLPFSSEGQAGKVMNPANPFWAALLENQSKWGIGQISATTSELLIMITEGRTVKGYLTLASYDTLKQNFSKKYDTYLTAIKIQDFPRSRQFKKIVYSA
jgi:hypothetical protein